MPVQSRDFGRGWRPGGTPGIQTRHSPGLGRCPGGTPSTTAVPGAEVSASGVGARMIVLRVVRVQETATTTRVVARRRRRESSRGAVGMLKTSRVEVAGGGKMGEGGAG